MNHVVLVGRLVRDPELRYAPSGTPICSFTIAVDRHREGADFIDIAAFQKLAETVANHLTKGRLVGVHGRLQVRSYEKSDGQKRKVTEVVANEVRFLGRKPAEDAPDDEEGVPF